MGDNDGPFPWLGLFGLLGLILGAWLIVGGIAYFLHWLATS